MQFLQEIFHPQNSSHFYFSQDGSFNNNFISTYLTKNDPNSTRILLSCPYNFKAVSKHLSTSE